MQFFSSRFALVTFAVALVFALSPAIASASLAPAPSPCATAGTPFLTFTRHITNNPDSGNHGSWAINAFTENVSVWVGTDSKTYCANANTTDGAFTTTGPLSPEAGAHLSSSITGTFIGGENYTIPSSFALRDGYSTTTSPATIVPLPDSDTAGFSWWVNQAFPDIASSTGSSYVNTYWLQYVTANNGTWINADPALSGGDLGDITGYPSDIYVNAAGGNDSNDGTTAHPLATIQAAINDVPANGTVHVIAGSPYVGNLTIGKKITLESADSTNKAQINGTITVTVNGATVSDLDITNPSVGYGVVVNGASNVTVSGNNIHDIGTALTSGSAQAIYLVGGTGASISGDSFTNNVITNVGSANLAFGSSGSAKGIFVGDSSGTGSITGLTISGNTISNIAASTTPWANGTKYGRGAYGILIGFGKLVSGAPTAQTTAVISGNTISDLSGLWAHAIGLESDTPSTVVSSNIVTALSDNKSGADSMALRLESNPSAATVSGSGNTYGSRPLVLGGSTAYVDPTYVQSPDPSTYPEIRAADGNSYLYYGVNAFSKIQDAVTAVSSGSTVNVAAGTYTEQVSITKDLKLVGAGASGTVIDSPDTLATSFTTSAANKAVVSAVGANDVEISGLTVNGLGKGNANYRFLGIAFYNAGGSVFGSTITGIRETPFNGDQHGTGIYAYNADGVTRTLSISNNTVSDYQKGGIVTNGTGLTAAISGNTVTGKGATPLTAGNGIQIGYGAKGSITGNTVSGNDCTLNDPSDNCATDPASDIHADGAAGILLYSPGSSVTVGNNILTGNQFGVWTVGATGVTINNNSITGSGDGPGIAIWDTDQWGATETSTTGTVDGNTLSGNDYGVLIRDYHAGGPAPVVTVRSNKISGNTTDGISSNVTVDASQNWWGKANGPTASDNSNADRGDRVTSNVAYRPWCRDNSCSGSGLDTTPVSVSSGSVDNPKVKGSMVVTVTITFNKDTMNTAISPVVVAGFPSPVGSTTVQQTRYVGTSWQGTVTVPKTLHTAGQTVLVEVSGAEDIYGNQLQGTSTPTSFIVDTVPPAIDSITTQQISAGTSGWLKIGDQIAFTVAPSSAEPGAKIVPLFYNGKSIAWSSSDGGATYVATYTVVAGDAAQASPLQLTGIGMTDAAGNISGSYDSNFNGAAGVTDGIDAGYPTVTVPSDVYASATAQVNTTASDTGSGIGSYQWSGSGVTFGNPTAADTTVTATTDNTYPLQLTVTDVAGNQTTKTVNLHWDTTPPSIGANSDISGVEASGPSGAAVTFADPSANDSGSGLDSVSCAPASGSMFALGTTAVTCTATDKAGNSAASHFNVGVVDTTAPTITLNGDSRMNVAINNAFADPGVTVVDTVDGTSDVATTTGAVDTSTAGTYTLTYGARDAHGNYAAEKARTVVVEGAAFMLATSTSGTSVTGTLATGFTASTTGSGITATFSVPDGLNVTGTSTWDGVLSLPTISTGYTGPTAPSGFTDSVMSAVEIGASGQSLTFDKGVRILFSGQAGNHVGWSLNGTFTEITTACTADSQTAGDALAPGGDCKIAVGSDLVVWTRHFTTFLAYTQTANPAPVSSGGGGGGGPMILGTVNGGQVLGASTGPTGQVLGAEAYNFTKNLALGSSGADVTELQKVLIAEGDLTVAAPTGYFGTLTKAAVVKYQMVHGISPASGSVGPLTRAELNKGSAPGAVLGASTGPKLSASQVASLVTLLQAFGVDPATIAKVKANLGY